MEPRNASMWTPERLLKLVIFACFLMVAALVFVFKQQQHLDNQLEEVEKTQEEFRDAQIESRERHRTVKGMVCRMEYAIGLESSPVCMTDELLEYWDPANSTSPHFPEIDRE